MNELIVTVVEDSISLVEVAGQGPTGPQGPPGAAGAVNYVASTALSGHIAIALNADGAALAADAATPAHQVIVGIAVDATSLGGTVQVISKGTLEHLGWSFTPNTPVFLGLGGAITQTVPATAAFSKVLGMATSATRITVDIQPAIFL